jgi:tetratricopeptide (TPR) repeat protein
LQKALEISPTSVLRQEKLGKICQKNNDTEGAEKAFRNVIRHSNNSVHDKPDNYYELARHLTSSVRDDPESKEGKRAAEEAQKALERVGQKFKRDEKVKLQTTLMEVNLLKSQNKDQEAMAKSVEAHKIMNEIEEFDNETMTPELGLERAKMELVKGNADAAANLLTYIADEHCDNLALMNEVDTLFGHDALKASKEKTVAINKEGITFYQQKKYDKAIATFTEALKLSPNHVGLNLNLIQALIENAKGQDETHRQTAKARCEAQLKKLSHIHDNHRQYERYKNLIKKTELLCA